MKVTELSNKIYTDQTGRFPVTSSRWYKYIMIAYDYDSNNILAEPLKSRTGLNIKTPTKKIRQLLISRGLTPQIHVLDNECSQILKDYMQGEMRYFNWYPRIYIGVMQQNAPSGRGKTTSSLVSSPRTTSFTTCMVLLTSTGHTYSQPSPPIKNQSYPLNPRPTTCPV